MGPRGAKMRGPGADRASGPVCPAFFIHPGRKTVSDAVFPRIDARARALCRTLTAHQRKTSPFKPVPKEESGRRRPIWVEPKMVVEVDFHGWTHGGRVRQASFQGVRRDKAAKDVVHEVKH